MGNLASEYLIEQKHRANINDEIEIYIGVQKVLYFSPTDFKVAADLLLYWKILSCLFNA